MLRSMAENAEMKEDSAESPTRPLAGYAMASIMSRAAENARASMRSKAAESLLGKMTENSSPKVLGSDQPGKQMIENAEVSQADTMMYLGNIPKGTSEGFIL